jgi:hypothetical protein
VRFSRRRVSGWTNHDPRKARIAAALADIGPWIASTGNRIQRLDLPGEERAAEMQRTTSGRERVR